MSTPTQTTINGIDTDALKQTMDAVGADAANGIAQFNVSTAWAGGTRTETSVRSWRLAGEELPRNFTIAIDEPPELLGTNTAANPQEYLFAAMNACMAATYVAACSMQGIELEHLSIETSGELDLRGFLGLDASVKSGYDEIDYRVHIKGNGTPEQFKAVHEWVKRTSPNYFNMATAIRLNAELVID